MKWVDCRSWEEAFWAVIPKRKFQDGPRDHGGGGKHEVPEQEDDSGHGSDNGETTQTLGETEDSEIEKRACRSLRGETKEPRNGTS